MMERHIAEYIKRDDVLDCFHDWVDRHGDVHTPDEMPEYEAIEALPTIELNTDFTSSDLFFPKENVTLAYLKELASIYGSKSNEGTHS